MTTPAASERQAIDVAAYVWPSYTGDEPRARMFWGEGMGEWQSVKNAVQKTPEHNWPRRPLWGYVNEADPYVMEMQIAAAADHGVNVFIYDWYWYDRRPFLEQCLNNGYLQARNNDRVKFYLMWANHDANHVWNIDHSDNNHQTVIWGGAVDRHEFEIIVRRVIERYFSHPSYYCLDGKPVFMVYELQNLINGLGGIDACCRALDYFRAETIKAGFPGLHLQAAAWRKNGNNLSGVDASSGGITRQDFNRLAFDSITHYQFVHFTNMNRDYLDILPDVQKEWEKIDRNYPQTYFPHVSIGWDNNPRFKKFVPTVCRNNTPENFARALAMARDFLAKRPERHPLVTINSWNEWTETSYLQPDDLHGYGYLKAVKDIFLSTKQ
ncbi:MAG: glycoside hydrolase family 99-like domain-containing protein [Lentisphaeria bacterium]|jgi:hypothetical protein